jgi:hypothetical protein
VTDRALPAIGVGVRSRPVSGGHAAGGYVGPIARPRADAAARPVVRRREALLTTPARAGMLFGVTAAIYAVTLAGITGLQAESDAAVAAGRTPYLDVVAESRAANDALASRVRAADVQVRSLVASYGTVGADVTAFETRLDELAALVADVQGSAAALPARIKLPSVTIVRVASGGSSRSSAPKTTTKTGASGR